MVTLDCAHAPEQTPAATAAMKSRLKIVPSFVDLQALTNCAERQF